jgi:hypothetical protein
MAGPYDQEHLETLSIVQEFMNDRICRIVLNSMMMRMMLLMMDRVSHKVFKDYSD